MGGQGQEAQGTGDTDTGREAQGRRHRGKEADGDREAFKEQKAQMWRPSPGIATIFCPPPLQGPFSTYGGQTPSAVSRDVQRSFRGSASLLFAPGTGCGSDLGERALGFVLHMLWPS